MERARIPSMYTTLNPIHMCWFGHVICIDNGQIPKDFLYGEVVQVTHPISRPQLHYKDICKDLSVNLDTWEVTVPELMAWRQTSLSLKRLLPSSLRQRGRVERTRPTVRQTHQYQSSSAFSKIDFLHCKFSELVTSQDLC